jgi:crotonobetainyl-CoA:carnitine CoA-transferase CaiB-like acyl-CoA transferase
MSFRPASSALSDLVVLDLTRVRSGPTCVRQFADWGANVIKIDAREEAGSDGAGPSDFSSRHDPDFQNLHRNKRAMALDLKNPDGIAIFKKMVAKADIVVENYRPDVKNRLGIDYESLKAINKRIILASISGFGQDGPYKDRPGVDQIAQGMSGLMSVTGEEGRGPMRVGIAVGDVAAGMCAAVGVLTALHERSRSGEGQWVQTSLLEALLFFLDFQGARYLMQGEVAKQAGNNHPTGVPTGTFKTSDGYVNIAPTPPMWKRFCKAIGKSEWGEKAEWASPKGRRAERETINGLVNAITSKETTAAIIEKMNAGGIPCGPVYDIGQAFNDPQVKHLGIAKKVPSKALGDITLIGQPVNLSRTKTTMITGAPEYAEQADEILAEFGYSSKEIESFRKGGAI